MSKVRLNGIETFAVHLLLFHTGVVVVANFLYDGLSIGIGRGFPQNIPQHLTVIFGQLIKTPPARLVWRDRIILPPAPTGIFIKVGTGIDGFIDGREIKRTGPLDGRRIGGWLRGSDPRLFRSIGTEGNNESHQDKSQHSFSGHTDFLLYEYGVGI